MKETKLLCMLMVLLLSVFCAVPAQARWYGAEEGRFISVAPYAPDVEHPYVYCANDPVNQIDPTGEFNLPGCAVAGACAAMLGWHINRCTAICGNEWGTRQVCGEDGKMHTQVYDTGQKNWSCIKDCVLGGLSGWRGAIFSTGCMAAIVSCLDFQIDHAHPGKGYPKPHGHWGPRYPNSTHPKWHIGPGRGGKWQWF